MLGSGSLSLALVRAPLSLRRLRARGAAWLVVYLALAVGLFAVTGRFIVAHEGFLRRALVEYVFPARWQAAGELLVERLFAAQEHAVLVNAAVGASLLLVQVLLFPVKEQRSASFEREARLKDGRRLAESRLTPLEVPAGEERRVHMEVPVALAPSELTRGTQLLSAQGWTLTLWLDVAPGFEFPIYLR